MHTSSKKELLPHEMAGKDIKDPNNDILNADWLTWYTDIQIKMQKVLEENKKIENDILRRQNRYIMREQDYRLQIEELQAQLRIRLDNDDSDDGENPGKPKTKMHPVIEKLRGQFKRSVDNIKPKLEKLK